MTRAIFLEPLWSLHAFQRQMLAYPPDGYQFVVSRTPSDQAVAAAARRNLARSLLLAADVAVPVALLKAWLQRGTRRPPGTTLTYAVDHLVFRTEPWVVEIEYASAIAGVRPDHLQRFKPLVERTLALDSCRKILCWSEAGRRSLEADLNAGLFCHKIELIPYAVPPKRFAKEYDAARIKLLFVGSGASSGAFEGRGSHVFQAFELLRQRFSNVELVVRSDVAGRLKARFRGVPSIKILDKLVSPAALAWEFKTADVFVLPSYGTLPVTLLEAMSYELPVVTIDSWANAEYVEHGRTGFVARRSPKVPRYFAATRQPNFLAPNFRDAAARADSAALVDLVEKVAVLVENPELRRQFGRAGRWEVEQGKFSLVRYNARLKEVLDAAIGKR